MNDFYIRKDGEAQTITAHDGIVLDPIERFLTRLLRREMFEALATQEHLANEPFKMVLFGSSVIQHYRPHAGYPVRRRARDIDIGIVRKDGTTTKEVTAEEAKAVKTYMKDAASIIHADIYQNRDGKTYIRKTYTPDEITSYLEGKNEKKFLPRETPLTIELELSPTYLKSPILPLEQLGSVDIH